MLNMRRLRLEIYPLGVANVLEVQSVLRSAGITITEGPNNISQWGNCNFCQRSRSKRY